LVRQGRLQIQTNSMIARLLGFLKLRWIQQWGWLLNWYTRGQIWNEEN
jgi:hypothetical protein